MILGAGIMQVPGIRIAKEKSWRVIIVDGNPDAVARDMGDHFECVDLKDRDGLLTLARGYAERTGLDGVFTAGTDFSSSVAWVAEKLGLPGISFATAMRATDKCLMRTAFAAAGVPSPLFFCWTGEGDARSANAGGLDFPLVVKPVDNMGARGVRRVENDAELEDACQAAISLSRSSRVIIEQYMEGPELSLDAIVHGGRVTVCGIADRHICFPPSFVEMGHTIPSALDPGTLGDVEKVFAAGIHAIGIDNGAAKGDIKLTARGPMVGEIAARLSGGYMSGWTFPLSSGVEVTEAALNVAVGLPSGDLSPRLRKTCAERALISMPGTVEEILGVEDARGLAGVEHVFLRIGPGDEVLFPANNVQKCGNVIATGESRVEAVAAAQAAIHALCIRLRPDTEKTTHFLFRGTGNDAYPSMDSELLRAIRTLPPYRGQPSRTAADGLLAVEVLESIERQDATDWHGMTMKDAVLRALARGGGMPSRAASSTVFTLSGLFWKAIVRGGAQGGTYLLESVRQAAARGTLREFLART
jgi:biotin carboxylase